MTAPDFNQIIDEAIRNAIVIIDHGDSALHVPVLDPYHVGSTTYHFHVGLLPGHIGFSDMVLGGLNTLHRTGDCHVRENQLEVKLGFRSLGFTGSYKLVFPPYDIGKFAAGVVDPSVAMSMTVQMAPSLHLQIDRLELSYKLIGFATIGANPIVDIASWLFSAVDDFMGTFLAPILSKAVAPALRGVLQTELDNVVKG